MPAALHGSHGDTQHLSGLCLTQTLVENQIDDLTLRFIQQPHMLMKLGPLRHHVGLVRICMLPCIKQPLIGAAFMVGSVALGTEEVPRKVNQLPPHLQRGEPETVSTGIRLDCLKSSHKSDQRVLQNVVAAGPPSQSRRPVEHVPRQAPQPRATPFDQSVQRKLISGLSELQQL